MRLTQAIINKQKLLQNLISIRKNIFNAGIMAIVKANAYGHGIVETTKILDEAGVEFFGVAFPEEGAELRRNGITKPILALVPSLGADADLFVENDIHVVLSSFESAKTFSDYAESRNAKIKSHIFIGTGMNRDGIPPEHALPFAKYCSELKGLELVGLCTHFAASENEDRSFTYKQLAIFNQNLEILKNNGFDFEYIHASNSAAIINIPEARFNLVRPGIFLYGYANEENLWKKIELQPALTIKTNIVLTKRVEKGDTVGYSFKFIADKPTHIGVLPIGYADGYFWSFTNKAECLIRGKRYKLVGSVCMDQCMVDIGSDDIKAGEEVVLLGSQGNETITAHELAARGNSLVYEVLTSISPRIPRVIIDR
ncbi:MAG: alanine racemase [Ignavibacteria bacterium]|nr:alanine racemase [Ignavibacteria bacterium]